MAHTKIQLLYIIPNVYSIVTPTQNTNTPGLSAEDLIATVKRVQVALNGQLAVHRRVLRRHVWLVEVIHMLHVTRTHTCRGNEK